MIPTLDYSYEIVSVNTENNFMEVKYMSPGKQDVTVGVHLPIQGVSLDDHLKSYAPMNVWNMVSTRTYAPQVGTKGNYVYSQEQQKMNELFSQSEQEINNRLEEQVKNILVKLGLIT